MQIAPINFQFGNLDQVEDKKGFGFGGVKPHIPGLGSVEIPAIRMSRLNVVASLRGNLLPVQVVIAYLYLEVCRQVIDAKHIGGIHVESVDLLDLPKIQSDELVFPEE